MNNFSCTTRTSGQLVGTVEPDDVPEPEQLRRIVANAAHFLPAQGPITVFIHHNTLHAFEHMPFEQAVVSGARLFGCHPFQTEDQFHNHLRSGRIRDQDLDAILIKDLGDRADELLGFFGTKFHLRRSMLAQLLHVAPGYELQWALAETNALRNFREDVDARTRQRLIQQTCHWIARNFDSSGIVSGSFENVTSASSTAIEQALSHFDISHLGRWSEEQREALTLHVLWNICYENIRETKISDGTALPPRRHRDWIWDHWNEDTDELINDVLIRFCAAFVDQGFAPWSLPDRDKGFMQSFMTLLSSRSFQSPSWLHGIRGEIARLPANLTPFDLMSQALTRLGVQASDVADYVTHSLLALRGWAGAIWQTELRGDRVARSSPTGSLLEFIAVRLWLEQMAVEHVVRKRTRNIERPLSLDRLQQVFSQQMPERRESIHAQRSFLAFQLAQVSGWQPETLACLGRRQWNALVNEIDEFNSFERRRIFHLAYERKFRNDSLDAVINHCRRVYAPSQHSPRQMSTAKFQIVCCIDEREESFRRHLEEIFPDCETFGAAGFFSVAMNYRGAADAQFTPLCPVIIQPRHYVTESVVAEATHRDSKSRRRRRTIGTVTHQVHLGSRTFAGGWLAAVLGSLASIPLVTRILYPRWVAKLKQFSGRWVRPPSATKLKLQRIAESPGRQPDQIGYSLEEMTQIVERMLQDIGLTSSFSRIILVVGHGSSSLNNPHESAHDCGACGGGRGGPNARAFVQMANHPEVRQRLGLRNILIPNESVFVAAYHNTCDDQVTYYDLDLLPSSHAADWTKVQLAIDQARMRSAHERCRRFESADLFLSIEGAIRHVEARAEDLSQVRPEYGHATNALCFVGRREWSRGLFLDRRAFLHSYDPGQDDDRCTILSRILQAVVPVCGGINLEYYFSFVDPSGYGCGTKLPHNIASLIGVMNGTNSDLRTGLPWQMVEIHEPVRLLIVIETTPQQLLQIFADNPGIERLIRGEWVQVATIAPQHHRIHVYRKGRFVPYSEQTKSLATCESSLLWYRGQRDHLGFASIGMTDSNVRNAS